MSIHLENQGANVSKIDVPNGEFVEIKCVGTGPLDAFLLSDEAIQRIRETGEFTNDSSNLEIGTNSNLIEKVTPILKARNNLLLINRSGQGNNVELFLTRLNTLRDWSSGHISTSGSGYTGTMGPSGFGF